MAAITSLGIGSGLDLNSLVNQLVALERRPLEQLQASARRLQGQVSSYGQIKSLFSGLQDAANRLTGPALWTQGVARSSNEAAVAVSGSTGAAAGSYAVAVQQLASGQTVAAGVSLPSAAAPVGSGTLTLERGAWNATQDSFDPLAGADPVSITIDADDTLQTLRDKINASGAGVQASLITDASGVRLALRSAQTGVDNGFRVSVADPSGNPDGLARFAYQGAAGGGMALTQAAANALATVNGIDVVSASNELAGTIEGVTLRLRQVTSAPVDVTVDADREGISTAIKTFADAYNALARMLAEQTRFDATSKVGGPLQGDSAATGLQARLRAVLNSASGASAAFPRLSDLGLELQRDGTLKLNQAKVDAAMGDLPELRRALAHSDGSDAANNGFARRYAQLAQQVLAVDGSITTRTEGLRERIGRLSTEQQRVNDRVERFQARLVAQYTAMDANVARLNAINGYLTQQLALMARAGEK